MKRIVGICLVLTLLLTLIACTAQEQEPAPDAERILTDSVAAGIVVSEAIYTNQNKHDRTIKNLALPIQQYYVLQTVEDARQITISGVAAGENDDWNLSAYYVAVYKKKGKTFQYESITLEYVAVSPAVELDFSGDGLAMLPLFESRSFPYLCLNDTDGLATGRVVISEETVKKIVAEFLPIGFGLPVEDIFYRVEIHFFSGLVLDGTTVFSYAPQYRTVEKEGLAKWNAITSGTYVER